MNSAPPEVLRIDDVEAPPPGPDEVQIDVRAIGLNRAEAMWRMGQYLEQPKLPARIGYEAAGTVAAVGSNVSHVKVGQRVASVPGFSMNSYGAYGERVTVPGWAAVPTPDDLSDEQAAAVWMKYLTAWGGFDPYRAPRGWRERADPGRLVERRAGGDPDRQSGRRDAYRTDPDPRRRPRRSSGPARRM